MTNNQRGSKHKHIPRGLVHGREEYAACLESLLGPSYQVVISWVMLIYYINFAAYTIVGQRKNNQ